MTLSTKVFPGKMTLITLTHLSVYDARTARDNNYIDNDIDL